MSELWVWSERSPKALSFVPTLSWHLSCSGVHSRLRHDDAARRGGFKLKVRKAHPDKFFAFQGFLGAGVASAIYHAYYNFCRVHQTLRVTPAMEAGLTDHVWSLEELVGLLDQRTVGAAA